MILLCDYALIKFMPRLIPANHDFCIETLDPPNPPLKPYLHHHPCLGGCGGGRGYVEASVASQNPTRQPIKKIKIKMEKRVDKT